MRLSLLSVLLLLGVTIGCVTDPPKKESDGGVVDQTTGPIIPWTVGNSWTYQVTDDTGVTTKVTTIDSEEVVGGDGPHSGDMAYKVITTKKDGTDQTISWQLPMDDDVIRYREQAFSASTGALQTDTYWDPYKLHIDGTTDHAKAGATWLEEYAETAEPVDGTATTMTEHDRWTTEQVDVSVTVPMGTFDHTLLYTKAGGATTKQYWYLRGVGKIKETGGQTEELVDYTVMP